MPDDPSKAERFVAEANPESLAALWYRRLFPDGPHERPPGEGALAFQQRQGQ